MKSVEKLSEDVFRRRDAYEQKRKRRKRAISAVSCFSLLLVLGVLAWRYSREPEIPAGGQQDVIRAESSVPEEVRKLPAAVVPQEPAGTSDGSGEEPVEAAPEPGSARPGGPQPDPGILVPLDRDWGGCYMDTEGRVVVCLTEDTPENRQEVLERNPGLSEENTIFQAVDCTLEYLQDLMKRLSEAELPACVSSVGLEIDRNRIGVYLKEEDPDGMAEVQAYDALGAIRFVVLHAPGVPYAAAKGPMP